MPRFAPLLALFFGGCIVTAAGIAWSAPGTLSGQQTVRGVELDDTDTDARPRFGPIVTLVDGFGNVIDTDAPLAVSLVGSLTLGADTDVRYSNVVNTVTTAPLLPLQAFETRLTLAEAAEDDTNANMNLNGSGTPQVFTQTPAADEAYRIGKWTVVVDDAGASSVGTIGAVAAVTNGVQVGVYDSDTDAQEWVSDWGTFRANGELVELSSDVVMTFFTTGSGGRAYYHVEFPLTHGGVQVVDGSLGHQIRAVVRDDLTGLSRLQIIVQGTVE